LTTINPTPVNTESKQAEKFGVPIADQEPKPLVPLPQPHEQVAGLLGDPLTGGVGGDSGQVHPAPLHLDEEQHIEPGQPHRVHSEEVRRQRAGGLRTQEVHPARDRPGAGVGFNNSATIVTSGSRPTWVASHRLA
jgi:hypothetical protein